MALPTHSTTNKNTLTSPITSVPSFWRMRGEPVFGVRLRVQHANLFIAHDQLRWVADQLHDAADAYEQAERDGLV